MHSQCLILALAVMTASASAQRIYVIDSSGGPGSHFLDLPPAEAVAQDGDIFEVRYGGPYTAITTSKALRIVGNRASITASLAYPFRVVGLPQGRDFVLQGVTFYLNPTLPAPLLEVVNCAGRVHLRDVGLANNSGQAAINVVDCAAVTMSGIYGQNGSPALRARNSTLVVSSSLLAGSQASGPRVAYPGIVLQDSSLFLADAQVLGGFGGLPTEPPAPAMTLTGSTVTVGGGTLARFVAGFYGASGGSAAVAAVSGQTSTVRIDPSVYVEARGAGQRFQGVNVVTTSVPSLSHSGYNTIFFGFRGDPSAVNVTLLGLPADPLAIPPAGSLWLAPVPILVVPGVPASLAISTLPRGTILATQVASIVGLGIELSNPTVFTVP